MLIDRKKILNLVNEFTDLCEKNNIWYSLDAMSILGAYRHGGFVPWHERFEVFVTVDSWNKLKRLFPKRLVDSGVDHSFKTLTAAWVNDVSSWNSEQPFIRIRVIVPTTLKKLAKYKSFFRKLTRFVTFRRDNIKRAIDDLYEPKLFQGFYFVDSRNASALTNWLQVLSGARVDLSFNQCHFKVAKEYKELLEKWYGKDFLNSQVPDSWLDYVGPNIVKKVK